MLYSIFFFLMYATSFIAMQYLNLYYKQLGFSSVNITKIIIISTIFSVASSLFLGYRFDRTDKKHFILYIILVGSGLSFISIAFFKSYYMILIFNIIFIMFYCSLQPLFTTITLENIKNNCLNFGKVRLMGTIGYCFASITIPLINYDKALFIVMFVILILMIILFTIILKTDEINKDIKEKRDFSLKELFGDKIILKLIIFVCIINITLGVYFNFFGIYFTEELGYSKKMYGVICAIATLSEIPFLIFSNKIFNRFNIKIILISSAIITSIRWVLCGLFTGQVSLLLIQLLHGMGFIVLMTSINVYITNNCEKKYVATLQSLFFISTLVFSKVVGSVVGGILPNIISFKSVFFINVFICLIAIIYIAFFVKNKDIDKICI